MISDEETLIKRVRQFQERQLDLILTKEAYFYQKARLMPGACFCLGWDTYVRVMDQKYYKGGRDGVIEMLQTLK